MNPSGTTRKSPNPRAGNKPPSGVVPPADLGNEAASRLPFANLFKRTPVPAGLKEVPELPGGLAIVGHTAAFVRDTIGLLHRAQREMGEICRLNIAGKTMVAMFGPDAHEAVFRAPDSVLNPQEAYKIMTPVFGKDIVYDASPERMTEQFKMLLPALKDRRMRTYGETIVAEVERSIADWGDEGEFDLIDYCRILTNYTSSACLLGHEFREGMTDEFARVYHDLERGVTPLAYVNAHLPIPSFRRRDKARARLVEMISEIVAQRRKTGSRGEDFLQTLMDARYKTGEALTEDELTGMLLAGMFAGHHTSSVTTAWTMIELIQNRGYGERVIAELENQFGENGAVTFEALRAIPLTDYAVRESLRLHPPLFMLVRVVVQDYFYKDYFIPKGTWVLISPTIAHRMPEVFADPMRFDPERFAEPRLEDKRDYALISFGGGRHKCMGNAFAFLQVKAILAILMRRYAFEFVDGYPGEDFQGLVVGPKDPCRLRYRRREVGQKVAQPVVATPTSAAAPKGCPMHGSDEDASDSSTADSSTADSSTAESAAPVTHERMQLTVSIDTDLCQGHAVCAAEAPTVFAVVDDTVTLLDPNPPIELLEQVRAAESYCPTGTISVKITPLGDNASNGN